MKQRKTSKTMKDADSKEFLDEKKNRMIILTGMMGAGKSTVGSVLARKLKLGFVDLDKLIEKKQNMEIPEIFRIFGEKRFREIETEAIFGLEAGQKLVISTGGGVVENKKNIERLRQIGRVYYLFAPHDVLYERIKNDTKRPLIMTLDPKKTLKDILDRRKAKYGCCDFKIDTVNRTAREIVNEIVGIYEKING